MTAAHIAVQELVHRYAQCIDNRDIDGALALFTADATVAVIPPGVSEARAPHDMTQFRVALAILDRYDATMHVIASHTAHIDGTHGHGETRCIAHHVHGGSNRVMFIRYDDAYAHTDHGWQFASRVLHVTSEAEVPWPPT